MKIGEIEKGIIEAFNRTIEDYNNKYIELEEDMRACMYYHLRPLIDKSDRLIMLLSHNVGFKQKTIKPDIIIFRDGFYLAAIEMKLHLKDKQKAIDDRDRLKGFKKHIKRSYFLHIDNKLSFNFPSKQDWHNNYYNQIKFDVKSKKTEHYHIKRGIVNK
jgi:hypothetical protein